VLPGVVDSNSFIKLSFPFCDSDILYTYIYFCSPEYTLKYKQIEISKISMKIDGKIYILRIPVIKNSTFNSTDLLPRAMLIHDLISHCLTTLMLLNRHSQYQRHYHPKNSILYKHSTILPPFIPKIIQRTKHNIYAYTKEYLPPQSIRMY
jgi:hypothetical protein